MIIPKCTLTKFYEWHSDDTILAIAGHVFLYIVENMTIPIIDYNEFRPMSRYINSLKEHTSLSISDMISVECDPLENCSYTRAFNEYDMTRLGHPNQYIVGVFVFELDNRTELVFTSKSSGTCLHFMLDMNTTRLWSSPNIVSGFSKQLESRDLYTVKRIYTLTLNDAHQDSKRIKMSD